MAHAKDKDEGTQDYDSDTKKENEQGSNFITTDFPGCVFSDQMIKVLPSDISN